MNLQVGGEILDPEDLDEEEAKSYDPKISERVAKIPEMLDEIESLLTKPQFSGDYPPSVLWRMRAEQAAVAKGMISHIDILLELDQRTTIGKVRDMFKEFKKEARMEIMLQDGVDEEDPAN